MVKILSFLRREARAQRILIVAIFFVSSSQFFFVHYSPPNREHDAANHDSFLGGPTKDRSSGPRSSGNAPLSPANNTKNLTFCGTCYYDLTNSCNERLKYLKSKYRLSEWEGKKNLMHHCGVDYATEPFVFIHAGPHKTGTTSIQSFLYNSFWRKKTFLKEDKFAIPTVEELPGVFGDIGPGLNLAHCTIRNYVKDGGQMNTAMCNRLRFGTFPLWLEKHYNQSQNILIVAEDFDRLAINYQRLQYFLRPYKRLRIVVGYRRQHDWLPSWYNQIVDLYAPRYIRGEARYPSFVEWINERYDDFRQVHAIEVATRYRNSGKFESVDILNMHDEVSLLEDLFCNYVPFANATCKAIKDGAKPTKPNVGRSHEYERLATKAHVSGKLPNYHKVIAPAVAEKIKAAAVKRGIFKDGDAYPKICLNQTFLDNLLKTEMEQERKYFPKWYESQGGDEGLRKAFEKSKYKLCSMDVEKVFLSGEFDPIFEELNK